MKIKKKTIIIGIFSVVLLVGACTWFYIVKSFYDFALSANNWQNMQHKNPNVPVASQEKNADKSIEELEKIRQQEIDLYKKRKKDDIQAHEFFKNKQKDIYITSFDNLKLHGIMALYPTRAEEEDVKSRFLLPLKKYEDVDKNKNLEALDNEKAPKAAESNVNEPEMYNNEEAPKAADNDNQEDSINLNGQLFSHKWVIIIHGYRDNADIYFVEGKKFYELGYNVLFVDLRGHGRSEGDFITMGWYEILDIKNWINQIIAWDHDAQIILYGVSMGAATVMMTLGEELPSNVKVGIEDCGYSSAYSIFLCCLHSMFGISNIPARLILNSLMLYVRIKDGYWLTDVSSVEQLRKNKRPILFIHGDSDTYVPTRMVNDVFEASNTDKKKVIIKNSPHAMNDYVDNQLYWSSIEEFLTKHIE
jgi:fermentation-respiration switch protein FrsA (DUF1100 family)